jgi:hypothetical protein
VDWYFSPGLPRPINNHGCIGDSEEKDEDGEDVRRLEIQRLEMKGASLFESISLMIYSFTAIQKSTESKRRCQNLQSKANLFLKYTTINQEKT